MSFGRRIKLLISLVAGALMMLKTIVETGLDVSGQSGEELSLFITERMG